MSGNGSPITVILATDSYLFGDGLTAILAGVPEIEVVGRVSDFDELLPLIAELTPNAIVISVRSRRVTTMATVIAVRELRDQYPALGIVIVSDCANDFGLELLRGGSAGIAFLLDDRLPDVEAIVDALRELQMGNTVLDARIVDSLIRHREATGIDSLTPREADVLAKMSQGLSNRAIAVDLHISVKSIEKAVTAIFAKLGPFNRVSFDRRVSATLVFLRSQTDPFGTIPDYESNVAIPTG